MDEKEDLGWEAKAFVYRLLSVGLVLPDERIVGALATGSLICDVEEAACIVGLVEHDAYRKALGGLKADSDERLGTLRREYTRLFSGPTAVLPAWESLFANRAHKLDGEKPLLVRSREAVDARRCYEEAGMTKVGGESPDHMSIECEFASLLCGSVARSDDEGARAQWAERYERFARTHLDRWLREFFSCLSCEARIPYYHVIGLIGARMR